MIELLAQADAITETEVWRVLATLAGVALTGMSVAVTILWKTLLSERADHTARERALADETRRLAQELARSVRHEEPE